MRPMLVTSLIALGLEAAAAAPMEPAAPPRSVEALVLLAHGGPPTADVEVEINDEFAMSIVDEPPLFTPIGDLLVLGLNTLHVTLKQPESLRPNSRTLELAVTRTEETSRGQSTVGEPLAELKIPAHGASGCEDTLRFWVGPPPNPPPVLKNRYWVFVTGPPVGLRVATIVNGTVVHDATSGNRFLEITPFVVKGKNTVELESRPTCLVEDTARQDPLSIGIGAAKVDGDRIEQTEPLQVLVDFAPRRQAPQPETVKRAFRAW